MKTFVLVMNKYLRWRRARGFTILLFLLTNIYYRHTKLQQSFKGGVWCVVLLLFWFLDVMVDVFTCFITLPVSWLQQTAKEKIKLERNGRKQTGD
jgi:hypothetical protein